MKLYQQLITSCALWGLLLIGSPLFGQTPQEKRQVPQEERQAAQQEKQIPILAWYSIPPGRFATLSRYQELADAGFTVTFPHIQHFEDAVKALDLSEKVGIKCVFMCEALRDNPEETVRKVMNHKGLFAYFLKDEPTDKEMDGLGEWARRIERIDSQHPCYLNLYPCTVFTPEAYQTHLDEFCKRVDLPQISFDHYPVKTRGKEIYLEPRFFENLEMVSQAAQRTGKPFWAFILSTAHTPYPIPTIGHLRLQAYADLAYGAQLLQYFTYWNPGTVKWNFHQAPILQNGQRSPLYEMVRSMNREIQQWAPVFAGCSVDSVRHIGEQVPVGTTPLKTLPKAFRRIETKGKNALLSVIENGGHHYAIIQNTSPTEPLELEIETSPGVKLIRADGTQADATLYGDFHVITAGNILVYEF